MSDNANNVFELIYYMNVPLMTVSKVVFFLSITILQLPRS